MKKKSGKKGSNKNVEINEGEAADNGATNKDIAPGASDAELDEQISQMDPAEIAQLKELAKKE